MNLDNVKIINLRINEYKTDIFFLITSGVLSNLLLFYLGNLRSIFLSFFNLPDSYNLLPLPATLIEIATWIILFLTIKSTPTIINTFLSSLFKNKYCFDSSNKGKIMSDKRFSDEWILQGSVTPHNGGILVSNSNSGCFIKRRGFLKTWKDFSASLDVSFPQQQDSRFERRIGIIFRAQNFEDYLMIELYHDNGLLKFRPHVRLNGNWDAPLLDLDVNIQKVSGNSLRIDLDVKDNIATVVVNNKKKKPFKWIIPTNIEVNLLQKTQEDKLSKTSVPELYFRNSSGMFGFRCYGNQYALIEALSIS